MIIVPVGGCSDVSSCLVGMGSDGGGVEPGTCTLSILDTTSWIIAGS